MTPLSAAPAEGYDGRNEQIRQVIEEAIRGMESGCSLSHEELIASHPHLMPELAAELAKLQLIADAAEVALLEVWNDAILRMEEDTANPLDSTDSTGTAPTEFAPRPAARRPLHPMPQQIGRYPILDRLGGGGQAEVYLAMHPLLRRQVVIKLSRRPLSPHQLDHDRFIAEGKRLAELEHPQLARVYDLDFYERHPFLVMQYVCGPNLRQYVQARPVSPREATALVARLAHALAAAHARGIAHQDIKPENVVIDPMGQPALIDFGLCVLHDAWSEALGHEDAICGTPEYMAPEQARGDKTRSRQRSDIFALGAVLYYLLTGEPPFLGESRSDALKRAARGDFDRAALESPTIPRALARICLRAMQTDPADRHVTATELAKDLERYLNGPKRWAMVGAGALLATLVGVAVWRSLASPPSPSPPPSALPLQQLNYPARNLLVTAYDPLYLAGIECFNRQAYFESHEIWEALWNETHGEAKQFYKGLIQAAVALYHLSRSNVPGAQKLWAKSQEHLAPFGPRYLGLDVDQFVSQVSQCVEQSAVRRHHDAIAKVSPAPLTAVRLELSPPPKTA